MGYVILGTLIGYVVGVFTPGVIRQIRAKLSAEAKKGVTLAEGEVRAAEADLKKKL